MKAKEHKFTLLVGRFHSCQYYDSYFPMGY